MSIPPYILYIKFYIIFMVQYLYNYSPTKFSLITNPPILGQNNYYNGVFSFFVLLTIKLMSAQITWIRKGKKNANNKVSIESSLISVVCTAPADRKSTRLNSSHVSISY